MKESLRRDHIQVDNEFMRNKDYENKEKFLALVFRILENDMTNATPICINHLLQILSLSDDKKNKASLKETLISMKEKGMITAYEDFMCMSQIKPEDMKPANMYYLKTHVSDKREEVIGNFTKFSREELINLMMIKERNKHIAFAIFFNIVSRLFESESSLKYAYPNITTIADEIGVDKKTVTKYIKVLKENEIMDYVTVREEYDKDKNYYVRWANRAVLKDFISDKSLMSA
ncbi:hypothetical protein COJ21_09805 [Priestia megaterium]|uniref:hypothetical protein n=1 Tax=Priestia megaterium TaxID=1404 RepID=UPI000BF4E34F|nr:hypothetical protein [Priestia megaterium]PFK77406.1 hypothetical protein COJ21_09805 [Priestia megaterium]